MTSDQAIYILSDALKSTLFLMGPLLLAALISGVVVGIVQTATQINEASITYLAKLLALAAVLSLAGPTLAAEAIRYMKANFRAVATITR